MVVGREGRVMLPAKLRAALGVEEGDELTATIEEGRIVLGSVDLAIRNAQKRWAKIAPGRSLVDELIRERRAEARRERKK